MLFRKSKNLGPFLEAPGKSYWLAGNVSLSLYSEVKMILLR